MEREKTLVLIKPDGVQRAIIGKIISRFEDTGLKVAAIKMVWVDDILAKDHYPVAEEWAKQVYEKTKTAYASQGKEFKYKTPKEYGQRIQNMLINFIKEGPVVAMILEGPHAIEITRKLLGNTEPRQAMPGTIRGDFISTESYAQADPNDRAVRNLIHASDSKENAEREISLWFESHEIYDYKNIHDHLSPTKKKK